MSRRARPAVTLALTVMAVVATIAIARADIAVDRIIVELEGQSSGRGDVEVRNFGDQTSYVVVEAYEILDPGTDDERRVAVSDPEALGLLVTPTRLVLPPGAGQVVRFVRLGETGAMDRVWRVSIRPVVGETTSDTNALQVLVGYGVLVVARPEQAQSIVTATRGDKTLELRNDGNSNALLFDGRQCDGSGERCHELPARRLYPGNSWSMSLNYDTPVTLEVLGPTGQETRTF